MEVIAASAVFTNAALIAFTGNIAINYTWPQRSWLFILMAAGLFSIRLLVAYYVPDTPTEVQLQLERQEFLVSKVIYNCEDDDDDAQPDVSVTSNYIVDQTDNDPM